MFVEFCNWGGETHIAGDNCTESHMWTEAFTVCGGSGGGSSGGSGTGSGGNNGGITGGGSSSSGGGTPIVTTPVISYADGTDAQADIIISLFSFNNLTLTVQQIAWLNRNPDKLSQIITFLSQNNTIKSLQFVQWAITYLRNNANTTWAQLQSKFYAPYPEAETTSTIINPDDITYSEILTQQALPSLSNFTTHFPKESSTGSYTQMTAPDVYSLVGGSLLSSYNLNRGNYSNACSIRGSRGLLYSGIHIPVLNYNGSQRTQKGSDLKNYILDAVSFNKFMVDKFGDTPHKLEGTAANDPTQVMNLLNGKNGIYVIINNNPSPRTGAGYSGHVDLILNGNCIGGEYLGPIGGVKSIKIWVLN